MSFKQKLLFDTTDAETIAASDSVGAYLRASDGTLLTHSDVGGKKALDVSIADGVNVEVDLSHVDDSVRLGDGTDFFTSTTVGADIGLDVNIINASIAVTATDLDIRDLSAAQDSVASWLSDGAGTALTSTLVGADQALDVNIVQSVPLSIEDVALANTAIASAANTLAVANTAQNVVASPLADRKYLFVMNNSNKNVYVGASGVTAANGFPLSPQAVIELRAGDAIDIEFVASNAGKEIRTLELS